jgi:hypothetical protein
MERAERAALIILPLGVGVAMIAAAEPFAFPDTPRLVWSAIFWVGVVTACLSAAFLLYEYRHLLRDRQLEQSLIYLASKDIDLGSAIITMVRKSAWARWYRAQHLINSGSAIGDEHLLNIASSIVWDKILDGELQVRGRAPGQLDYGEIPRTHWRSSAFHFVRDDRSVWKMVIFPTGGVEISPAGEVVRASDPAAMGRTHQLTNYDSFLVDAYQFEKLWPAKDAETDKARKKFLRKARCRSLDKDEIRRLV